jgi:hypothetical protein
VRPKFYITLAKVCWNIGKGIFNVADFVGDYKCLAWSQKPLDWMGDVCMGVSAKLLMKGYWDIDPDSDWDS